MGAQIVKKLALTIVTLLIATGSLRAQADGEKQVRDFFSAHCTECHDAETKKKGLRLDNIVATFSDRTVRDRWAQIHDRIRLGEMPPKAHPQPKPDEVKPILAWIAAPGSTAWNTRIQCATSWGSTWS